jgi:hypothetical protein
MQNIVNEMLHGTQAAQRIHALWEVSTLVTSKLLFVGTQNSEYDRSTKRRRHQKLVS